MFDHHNPPLRGSLVHPHLRLKEAKSVPQAYTSNTTRVTDFEVIAVSLTFLFLLMFLILWYEVYSQWFGRRLYYEFAFTSGKQNQRPMTLLLKVIQLISDDSNPRGLQFFFQSLTTALIYFFSLYHLLTCVCVLLFKIEVCLA